MTYNHTKPYNDLPLLPPLQPLETNVVLKRAIDAHRALAELKGAARLIPNQEILLNSIALQEARSSSAIENIVTTNDELFRAAADETVVSDPATKEVLRYREALWHGYKRLRQRPLSTNLFVEIMQSVTKSTSSVRKVPGTHIARGDGSVVYTPPDGESIIRDKLANLESFIHVDDGLDPLVKLAAVHYQFEAIHPFHDGNGRTGRIVNILFLVDKGLLDLPILYLSGYILAHKPDYYQYLLSVTEQATWEPWTLFMLDAVRATAQETHQRIKRIVGLMEDTQKRVQAAAPKIYSKDLIEALFIQPYCKLSFIQDTLEVARQTAAIYLKALVGIKVIESVQKGREVYYLNKKLMLLLSRDMLENLTHPKNVLENQKKSNTRPATN
jgi:Fic family protein